jgi:Zn finger protein HypA/HybF involved in hydrogenase expression
MSQRDQKTPMHVHCRVCGHGWIAFMLPMKIDEFAREAKDLRCPRCGAPSREILSGPKAPSE